MNLPSYIIDELQQSGVDAEMATIVDKTTELSYLRGTDFTDTLRSGKLIYMSARRRDGGSKVHVIVEVDLLNNDVIDMLNGITELIKERKDISDTFKKWEK